MKTRLATLLVPLSLALSGAAFLRVRAPQATAVEGLEAAAGVEATLFAQAPMVVNPIAMDVDARGRVWVTEGRNYRDANSAAGAPPVDGGDRIVILEDGDGDGRADTQKTFYQGPDVNAAMGIAVLGNRAIVSAYENIFLFTDVDGDDRADEKRVIFKRDPANHDHTTHSFVLGPDGRLYFNTGNVGGALRDAQGKVIVDRAGKRVVPDSGTYRQGMVFRVDQDFSHVEVIGDNFRNPFELALDSYGTIWQSDNDDDGNRAARVNYVMEYGDYGYRDQVTGASWQTARAGLESAIPLQHWHQNDPGVVPNLLLTGSGSPAGMTFYEGALLPAPFRDVIIHADAGRSVVRAYPTVPSGAGYTATMVTLLRTTTDRSFRPVDVAPAPDGSLFVADWYDPVVGGHAAEDFAQGRIIRLAPPGARYSVPPLDVSTPEGAVQALRSPAPAVRYHAYAGLSRLGAAGDAALWQLWADANPRMRARALWLLAQRGSRATRYLEEALRDRNPDIRITALRAARLANRNVLTYARRLVNDSSARVRREVALALRNEDRPAVQQIWIQLARQHDGADRWYLEALGAAADGRWKEFLPAWRTIVRDDWDEKPGRDIVWRAWGDTVPTILTTLIYKDEVPPAERERLLRSLDFYKGPARERALMDVVEEPAMDLRTVAVALLALDSTRTRMTAPLARALDRTLNGTRNSRYFVDLARRFDSRGYAVAMSQIALEKADSATGLEAARLTIRWVGIAPFRQAATGPDTAAAHRAVTVLGAVGTPEAQGVIEEVALSSRPLPLRRAAVLAFGRLPPGDAASPALGDRRLLQLVETAALPADLREPAATVLHASPRPDVRAAAARLLPSPSGRTSEGGVLPAIAELASRSGDAARGRAAFVRACAACHQAEGTGVDFGPGLSGIGSRLAKSALYSAILEPSVGIAFGHEGYLVRMNDGRELVGILADATATEIALKTAGGASARYPRGEIAMILPLDSSLMPEGLEASLSERELVDLVEYLSTLRATAP
jgi:putative membrane-bound dehydrogenase-like protein